MDLFGRKASKENEHLRRALAKKTRYASVSKGINKSYRAKIVNLESIIRLKEAQLEVAQFDIDRLKEVLNTPKPAPSSTPLYYSETEEDILHAQKMQRLSLREAEDMLRELDFENTDILLDEPESDLTLY